MYPKQVAEDAARFLQGYLTFQAVRLIIQQLSETNPGLAIWLSHYSSDHRPQDDEAYLAGLMLEHKEMVLRVLTVREHLAEEVLEFLPAMVHANITQANIDHRRQLLERLTRSQPDTSAPEVSPSGEDPLPPDHRDP